MRIDNNDGLKTVYTSFAVVIYDRRIDSTIVLEQPVTGRSYQIRLHLQIPNRPLANDSNYGGDNFYKNEMGKYNHDAASEKLDEKNRQRDGSL